MANFNLDDAGNDNVLAGSTVNGTGQTIESGGSSDSIRTAPDGDAGAAREPESSAASVTPKRRRGRQPYPRDAAGNIIRPANTGTKDGLGVTGTKLNDRAKVRQQIQGIHFAVAMLTKQPVFALHDEEAINLTNALCDVLDYHEINLTATGGQYGLYLSLIITVYSVYAPRVSIIKNGDKIVGMASKPATPEEAKPGNAPKGAMDFSADVSTTH